jgi:hypothetical protein
VFLAACGVANPTARASDKSHYTLFNPTPRDRMRDFSTDRPDVTESAYTLDAGHVQVEMSLLEYTHDNEAGDFDEFSIAPSNIKIGLTNNIDLQLVLEPYIHQTLEDERSGGFGATQLRLKVNLWGNDGGDTAFALMPYVQFPTADDDIGGVDQLEGGLIAPIAFSLKNEWTLSAQAEIDFVRNDDDDDYGYSLLHTASIGHPIAGELSGYVEYVGVTNWELSTGYIALAGGGVTYMIGDTVQLDSAIYFGISESADDVAARLGISLRM